MAARYVSLNLLSRLPSSASSVCPWITSRPSPRLCSLKTHRDQISKAFLLLCIPTSNSKWLDQAPSSYLSLFPKRSQQPGTGAWVCWTKDSIIAPSFTFFSTNAQDTDRTWHLRTQLYQIFVPTLLRLKKCWRKVTVNTIPYRWHSHYHYDLKRSWGYLHWVYISSLVNSSSWGFPNWRSVGCSQNLREGKSLSSVVCIPLSMWGSSG